MTAKSLSILFALQLFLAAVAWWPSDHAASLPHPLLEIDPARLSALAIAASPSEGEPVSWLELAHGEGRERVEGVGSVGSVEGGDGEWRIASQGGYPADDNKVTALIEKLAKMEVRRPIANRESSHNALKVGDKEWGRRVRLTTEAGERELVIGAAKSNSVNVRFADESDVYVASGLSEWSLRDDARSYWNPVYLEASPTDVSEIRVQHGTSSLLFAREGEAWRVVEPATSRAVDGEAVDEFVAAVTTVRMDVPVGSAVLPEHGLDGTIRVSWLIDAENESVAGGYAIGAENGANRYLKSDTSPFVVVVAAASLARVIEASIDEFLLDEVEAEPAAELE
jgi:hypothetical protein